VEQKPERPIILPKLHDPDPFFVSNGVQNVRYTAEQVNAFATRAVREDREAGHALQQAIMSLLEQVQTLGVSVPLKMWLAAAGVDKRNTMGQPE